MAYFFHKSIFSVRHLISMSSLVYRFIGMNMILIQVLSNYNTTICTEQH